MNLGRKRREPKVRKVGVLGPKRRGEAQDNFVEETIANARNRGSLPQRQGRIESNRFIARLKHSDWESKHGDVTGEDGGAALVTRFADPAFELHAAATVHNSLHFCCETNVDSFAENERQRRCETVPR